MDKHTNTPDPTRTPKEKEVSQAYEAPKVTQHQVLRDLTAVNSIGGPMM